MLPSFEKRYFDNSQKLWVGRYRDLTNVLHWHPECELIRVVCSDAEIKIGENVFKASAGECFFCSSEQVHYIVGDSDSIIDIMIFHTELIGSVTQKYKLISPCLKNNNAVCTAFEIIRAVMSHKPRFYSQTLDSHARMLLVDIFNSNAVCERENKTNDITHIINKIHESFATVTFDEIVRFSGYSPAYFSRTFKRVAGMSFSNYLNYIKIENAVSLIQNKWDMSVTDIASACGFSTIRNFNRVFKSITGFTPSTLPPDFTAQISRGIYTEEDFDPTVSASTLLY